MNTRFLFLLAALAVAMGAGAQTPRTAVDDVEIMETGRLAPRVEVTPYSDEDDIERLAYGRSAYYLSLSGSWRCDLRDTYIDRSAEVEGRNFKADDWPEVTLPCRNWQRNGDAVKLPPIGVAGRVAHEGNASALLFRTFEVGEGWKDHKAVLRLQGRSAYHVWVNRQYVGYGEDSRAVSEFDITRQLRPGKRNEIAIQLVALSTGSLLESAYEPLLNGITDDVAIAFYPPAHLDDYAVHADYEAASRSGQLSIDATVVSSRGKGRYYLEVAVWNPQGREAVKMGKWLAFDKRNAVEVHLESRLNEVAPWSAERPSRYTVVMRLLDETMQPLMSTGTRIGFRTVAVDGSRLLVNGRPVTLRGVAYVDNGQAVEDMRADLLRMKHNNINAVRTIHYSPAREVFYDLCDELGLFVMCDANLQPFSSNRKAVATDADYADLFSARVRTMYGRLKNHASIILWSLGGSNDNGVCMTQAYRTLKQLDATRPVLFAGATTVDNSDMQLLTNPSVQDVRKQLALGLSRPLLVAAYGTTEGNPYGGLQELWGALASATAGGFATSWNSYTVGDAVTGQTVTHTGIGGRDVVRELREAYRPFDITLQNIAPDAAEFAVTNRNHTLALADYRVGYTLYSNLKPRIIEGDLNAPLAAGGTHTFKLRLPKLNLYAGEELMIRFEVRPRDLAPLSRQTVLSTTTFVLPSAHTAKQPLPDYDRRRLTMQYDDSSRRLTVTGADFSLYFDCARGALSQMVKQGDSLMQAPLALDFWRQTASGDAQLHSRATLWQTYRDLRSEVVDVDYRATDSSTVLVNMMLRYSSATGSPLFDVRQRYTVLHTGDVLVDNEVRSVHPTAEPPRVGLRWEMPVLCDSAGWFGHETACYSDRKAGVRTGQFGSRMQQLRGCYADTRRMTVGNSRRGLYVDFLDTLFAFEAEPAPSGWTLHADYRMAPAGGIVTPMPTAAPQVFRFVAHLRPYDAQTEDPDDFCRTAYPLGQTTLLPMPVITAGRDHFDAPMEVTLSLPAEQGVDPKEVAIYYTLDGSTPDVRSARYREPFTIEGSTTVNARAVRAGMSPSFVSSRSFYYDYVSSVTFDNKPNTPYNRHYERALTDGVTGSVEDLSHGWIGFSGNDLSITVTLGKPIDLDEVQLRFAHQPEAWIFAPTALSVSTSDDGVHFSAPVEATLDFDAADETMATPRLLEPAVRVAARGVRYVKIVARNMGRIPDWHTAKGLRAWLLTDEITLTEMMP